MNAAARATPRWQYALMAATLALSALLLFSRLGHYALWDDEAHVALIAESVWRTGDTSAMIGKNRYAYRGGNDLRNLHTRCLSPLQYYVAAPFVGLAAPPGALAARLPFACVGLALVGLMLAWLKRATSEPVEWTIACIAIVCSVSLFLYCRQCRYYSLAVFFTVLVAYLYWHWQGGRREVALFALASVLLLASHYIAFAACYACLAIDYLLWGIKRYELGWREWAGILVPLVALGGIIVGIWNPLDKDVDLVKQPETFAQKLTLLGWSFRDINLNEFGSLPILAAGVLWSLSRPGVQVPVRAVLALVVYLAVATALSPQKVALTSVADVRYLVPVIPLCIAASVPVLAAASRRRIRIALPLALLAFGSNLVNGGSYAGPRAPAPVHLAGFSSTIASYAEELLDPPGDPFTPTAEWINRNAADGASIWVVPDYAMYPLMYHAPRGLRLAARLAAARSVQGARPNSLQGPGGARLRHRVRAGARPRRDARAVPGRRALRASRGDRDLLAVDVPAGIVLARLCTGGDVRPGARRDLYLSPGTGERALVS